MADQELKDKILEWFDGKTKGEKKKYYMKDVVKGLSAEYDKKSIQKAVNELIEEDKLMWFSTGSSSMITLPKFHKG